MKEGWSTKLIQDICLVTDYVANGSFASLRANVKSVDEPDYAILVRMTDFTKRWSGKYKYVNESAYKFLKKSSLEPNDLLMCNVGDPGKVFLLPDLGLPMTLGPNSILIRAKTDITSNRLLYYYFESNLGKSKIASITSGAAQKKFNKTSFRNLSLKLPSITQQKRIVAILDEAFAGIDAAIANTEKNLANARELFESYLNSVFIKRGDGWIDQKFGEICGFVRGPFGGSLKKSCFVEDGFAVYEQQHAINDQFESIRYFIDDKKFQEMQRFELLPGDLIMSCSGTMGRVAIVPDTIKRGVINQALLKLTPSNKIDAQFLRLWMESDNFIEEIEKHSQGAAIKNVASVKVLKEIEVPSPDLSAQKEIVSEILNYREQTNQLELIYQRKLDSLKELKQSLLQKAFSGELTEEAEKLMDEAVA